MAIPPMNEFGLLPPGVVDATLDEIAETFCWNDHRRSLWDGFMRFIQAEYRAHQLSFPLWIDGSFVRSKPMPSDIDVVVDITGTVDEYAQRVAMEVRFANPKIKKMYGVDLWVNHPVVPNDFAAFFQYVGDKCAIEKQIDPKHPKGILRIRP